MTADSSAGPWAEHPQAAALVAALVQQARTDWVDNFESQLRERTATRLADWLDHLLVPAAAIDADGLQAAGFALAQDGAWRHGAAALPAVAVSDAGRFGLVLATDSVDAFAAVHGCDAGRVEGELGAALRRLHVDAGGAADVWVVERQGTSALDLQAPAPPFWVVDGWQRALLARPRFVDDPAPLLRLLEAAMRDLDRARVATLFFAAERDYWMSRNLAARLQYARQQALGLGWANRIRHGYRSSRERLGGLMAVFDALGLERHECLCDPRRGLALQLLRQPDCGIVASVEVDLLPGEDAAVFARPTLPPAPQPAAPGRWCGLHGESAFTAGLHHLAVGADCTPAQSGFAGLGLAARTAGGPDGPVRSLVTAGQPWPVADSHLYRMLDAGWLDEAQAATLKRDAAAGSCLILEQRERGYPGLDPESLGAA